MTIFYYMLICYGSGEIFRELFKSTIKFFQNASVIHFAISMHFFKIYLIVI
jgi:hypothetical protein